MRIWDNWGTAVEFLSVWDIFLFRAKSGQVREKRAKWSHSTLPPGVQRLLCLCVSALMGCACVCVSLWVCLCEEIDLHNPVWRPPSQWSYMMCEKAPSFSLQLGHAKVAVCVYLCVCVCFSMFERASVSVLKTVDICGWREKGRLCHAYPNLMIIYDAEKNLLVSPNLGALIAVYFTAVS